ncbi:hypothetical protein [Rhodopseudomonas palustris]|uniref:Uncharacterized protein n=1 Tax=Rhodopseudomonas palustris (strain BisB18) TaxID=316056 RepID=Q20Z73_RHOPB
MLSAARFQFERIVREYAVWRTVDDRERSPAAAWWWGPALAVLDEPEAMPPDFCRALQLPPGSTFARAASVFITAIADQTSLPWPDEFPRIRRRDDRGASSELTDRSAPSQPHAPRLMAATTTDALGS